MKTTILKISVFLLIFSLMGAGCGKDVPDEALRPGIAIYKTRNDYFNNVHTWLNDGRVIFKQSFHQKVEFDGVGNIHYKFRARLVNGYIFAGEEPVTTAFLSYTIQEYYDMESQKNLPTTNEIKASIIDADPFTEYYYDTLSPDIGGFVIEDTAKINEIIRNGEIEKYFKKLK